VLLLAPSGQAGDWPATSWQQVPDRIRAALPGLRCRSVGPADGAAEPLLQRAAQLAASDVVLASDPITIELALLCGLPLVALGRLAETLPAREGVKGLGIPGDLAALEPDAVLTALGLG
jgi:hypothetical protein